MVLVCRVAVGSMGGIVSCDVGVLFWLGGLVVFVVCCVSGVTGVMVVWCLMRGFVSDCVVVVMWCSGLTVVGVA